MSCTSMGTLHCQYCLQSWNSAQDTLLLPSRFGGQNWTCCAVFLFLKSTVQFTPLLGHHHLRSDDVSFSESSGEKYLLLACLYCVVFWSGRVTTSSRLIFNDTSEPGLTYCSSSPILASSITFAHLNDSLFTLSVDQCRHFRLNPFKPNYSIR